MSDACSHQDAWLSLPWLANGRLSGTERLRVEEHVRGCALCAREVALQRRLCDLLTEPERVTYAPGPSFRKLMDRIDGRAHPAIRARVRGRRELRQQPLQLGARVKQPRLHRVDRAVHDLRDLLTRVSELVAEFDREPLLHGQLRERPCEPVAQLFSPRWLLVRWWQELCLQVLLCQARR